MKINLTSIINSIKRHLAVASCIAALFLTVIIVAAVISLAGEGTGADSAWGDGITEGIPRFGGEGESLTFGEDGEYAAAYYTNVTGDAVSEYVTELEGACQVKFSEGQYPRTAVYGEKIIAVHYNATEMKMSVTVAKEMQLESSYSALDSNSANRKY